MKKNYKNFSIVKVDQDNFSSLKVLNFGGTKLN